MLIHCLAFATLLTVPVASASTQPMQMRVVATSPSGSVWRMSSSTIERTGSTATAWFFVDHRRDPSAGAANSRVHYRFDCVGRRATRLEQVVLGAHGRVLAREGAGAPAPATSGSFVGTLLESACG